MFRGYKGVNCLSVSTYNTQQGAKKMPTKGAPSFGSHVDTPSITPPAAGSPSNSPSSNTTQSDDNNMEDILVM